MIILQINMTALSIEEWVKMFWKEICSKTRNATVFIENTAAERYKSLLLFHIHMYNLVLYYSY